MRKVMIEICSVALKDCIRAEACGADRIELCASMAAGGLTPSMGLFQLIKEHIKIPVMIMIRPRGAGFCYDNWEYEVMKKDTQLFLDQGADGCVFGILHKDKTVDKERTKELVTRIHQSGKEAVFHRAFDECPNKEQAIRSLIDCGVDRILTAGGQGNAMDHLKELYQWQKEYGSRIQFQTCGTIRSDNIKSVVDGTEIYQVHSACRVFKQDPSDEVCAELGYHNAYDKVCAEECSKLVKQVY